MDSSETNRPIDRGSVPPPRYLRQRQLNLYRVIVIILIMTAALFFFINWYRKVPQGIDCAKMSQRIALALNDYRKVHHKLPPILDTLGVHAGRYSVDHYEYWFDGMGGPENIPEGTIVAYCKKPHIPMFSPPWRSALIFYGGQIVVTRIPENEFQKLLKMQRPPEQYFQLQ